MSLDYHRVLSSTMEKNLHKIFGMLPRDRTWAANEVIILLIMVPDSWMNLTFGTTIAPFSINSCDLN